MPELRGGWRIRSLESSLATQGMWGYLELKEEIKGRKRGREEKRRKKGNIFLSTLLLSRAGSSGFCSVVRGGTVEKPAQRQDVRSVTV